MKHIYIYPLICLILLASSCKKESTKDDEIIQNTKKDVVTNYADIVFATYSDALSSAKTLQTAINNFVDSPDALKLETCKEAWLAARVPYNQTEPFRFYNGPIDNETGPEGLMNAWPLDENFIDYVNGNAAAGIINDPTTYPTISTTLIESLNTASGEADVSAGYHAIEFLLWGQDTDANGPGTRSFTDYTTATNATRRGHYLKSLASLLVSNLQTVTDEWDPSVSGNYRANFTSVPSNESLKKIIQGLGFFSKGELSGERMAVALEEQLQEHEHSCFSDNTHNDIIYGCKGIQNVFTGKYIKSNGEIISGESIYYSIYMENPTLAKEIETLVAQSAVNAETIPTPFDQQILAGAAGRTNIQTTITSLRSQADKLAQAANELNLGNITIE